MNIGFLTAFVTGASRGIGFAIAEQLVPHCSKILIASQHEATILDAAAQLKSDRCSIYPMWGDLSDGRKFGAAAASLASAVSDQIDLLVLDAGYYVDGSLGDISDEDFERNMLVNCHSSHYVVSELLPFLRRAPTPRIVIIGSTAAYEAYPLVPTYGIAKWGLRGYAVNLRRELMKENIGVTFVAPGGTLTDMWAGADLPKDRLLKPSDIGKMVTSILALSSQAVVEEIILRPMLGDIHE